MERPRRACTSRKRPSHDVTDDGSGRSDCDASREVDPADASGSSASVNDSKGNLSGTSNALYKSVIERNKQIKNVQNSPSEHIPDEWQVYAKTIICTHGGKHRYRGKGKRPRQEVRPMGCTTQINAGVQVTIDSLRKTGAKTKSILEFIVENSDSCPTPQDVQNLIRNLKNREQGGMTRSHRVKK
ncbi:hypothetical protein JG687_00003661 [Phytophthora cactorum]|uniref:Uncharacterized protein n=1 Tax=Phytophthora cactorum TaxID=29920 RepID=A0A329SAT8_9STRA|nr:hypothetical protein JG687_00003661 [Phytophthora cactorum]RAW33006.1 hypothetical protein PC110_g10650 [Phytophthora cactorum]